MCTSTRNRHPNREGEEGHCLPRVQGQNLRSNPGNKQNIATMMLLALRHLLVAFLGYGFHIE
jgi:hypothetical protein